MCVDYGSRIKKLRHTAGLSANALGKMVDLDPTTIYKMEAGTSKPSLDALERICAALGITLAEFFAEADCLKVAESSCGYGEYADLPKEAIERVEELISLYRMKYKTESDAKK